MGPGDYDFTSDREEWLDKSACLNQPLEKFFPTTNGDTEPAKKLCASCDVRIQCLAWILMTETPRARRYGIVGGLTAHERDELYLKLNPEFKRKSRKKKKES